VKTKAAPSSDSPDFNVAHSLYMGKIAAGLYQQNRLVAAFNGCPLLELAQQ
jgi:hypothetical protein